MPWGIGEALVVLLVVFLLGIVMTSVLVLLVGGRLVGSDFARALLLPLSAVVLGAVPIVYVRFRHQAVSALWGWRTARNRDVLIGLGAGFVAWIVVNRGIAAILQAAFRGDLPDIQPEFREAVTDPTALPFFIIGAVVLAPLAEEVYYRGVLFQALRQRLGPLLGAVLSALVFGLLHGGGPSVAAWAVTFALVFPLAVFLAWLFHWRGTIAAPISAHVMFNILSVVGLVNLERGG